MFIMVNHCNNIVSVLDTEDGVVEKYDKKVLNKIVHTNNIKILGFNCSSNYKTNLFSASDDYVSFDFSPVNVYGLDKVKMHNETYLSNDRLHLLSIANFFSNYSGLSLILTEILVLHGKIHFSHNYPRNRLKFYDDLLQTYTFLYANGTLSNEICNSKMLVNIGDILLSYLIYLYNTKFNLPCKALDCTYNMDCTYKKEYTKIKHTFFKHIDTLILSYEDNTFFTDGDILIEVKTKLIEDYNKNMQPTLKWWARHNLVKSKLNYYNFSIISGCLIFNTKIYKTEEVEFPSGVPVLILDWVLYILHDSTLVIHRDSNILVSEESETIKAHKIVIDELIKIPILDWISWSQIRELCINSTNIDIDLLIRITRRNCNLNLVINGVTTTEEADNLVSTFTEKGISHSLIKRSNLYKLLSNEVKKIVESK